MSYRIRAIGDIAHFSDDELRSYFLELKAGTGDWAGEIWPEVHKRVQLLSLYIVNGPRRASVDWVWVLWMFLNAAPKTIDIDREYVAMVGDRLFGARL